MLTKIIEDKKNYNGAKRNFLRVFPGYIQYLKYIFGNLSTSELNFLINHEKKICNCGNECDFVNHESGYKEKCNICLRADKCLKIANQLKGRKNKTICKECGTSTVNNALCDICSSKFTCICCGRKQEEYKRSTEFNTKRNVCKDCELTYLISTNIIKSWSPVNFHTFKPCEVCGELFQFNLGGNYQTNCKKHRKQCVICNSYFNKQGKTCSAKCSKELHHITNLERYGSKSNLGMKGIRKNDISFWLNKCNTKEEALFEFYKYQSKFNTVFASLDEFYNFFNDNIDIIKKYSIKIVKDILGLSNIGFKLLEIFINKNNIISNNEKILFSPQTYGTIVTVVFQNEVYKFRSKKEFRFYLLLMKNSIKFKTNKEYPDSNFYYDFYLPDFDIYVEITGFMNNEEYRNKMYKKQELFNSVLLDNVKEMKEFLKNLKGK